MNHVTLDGAALPPPKQRLSVEAVDRALTAQLAVAWAGESGEEPRLRWWRTDLASEFGGEDLFRRLLPHTWRWAVLQGVREAARRRDAELRRRDANPDRVVSLYSLGFDIDERLDDRLLELKRAGDEPAVALPGLGAVIAPSWERAAFARWVEGMGEAAFKAEPLGRRLVGELPSDLDAVVARLVGGLAPLGDAYPLPHFRRPG